MVFGQASPGAKAAAAALTSKPAPAAAKPAATKPAAPAPAAEEGAGRTMMFQTGNLKSGPKKPEPETGATMVFGQSPVARPGAPTAKPSPKGDPEAGATMVFGQSPIAAKGGPAAAAKAPGMTKTPATAVKPPAPAKPAPEPEPAPAAEPEAAAEEAAVAGSEDTTAAAEPAEPAVAAAGDHGEGEDMPDTTGESEAPEGGVEAEGAEPAAEEGAFDKAPPRGLLIGVVAGLVVLVLAVGGLLVFKKMAHHPPPQAAVDALTAAQAEADKDSLASIANAEKATHDAMDQAGPKAYFPQATAQLARIEVQWADALNDQAALLSAKNADDANAPKLQEAAKGKLKAAFDLLTPAWRADSKSPDIALALSDYYRAQRSNSNMNKYIRLSGAGPDDPRAAQVQALAAAQEDDGAEKAIPKLKAVAGQSARLHFRLAEEYAQLKDDANTRAELAQTLKLSPQHERAKLLQDQLGPAQSAAEQPK
ncbi:MAG TPA: hypothetical protein VLW85_10690 [Myxococcales bacterium]|nr:hypothetical protein [Myxococcales bacterium]